MSRATISTGNIDWHGQQERRDSAPGYLLVLGDFSGCGSRGENSTPRLLKVDRDTIDEVFARLDVRLQLPLSEQPLRFSEPDELHPDFLYEHVDLFEGLRDLRRRLQNPQTFAAAAAELTGNAPRAQRPPEVSWDELLAGARPAPAFDVQSLIRDIVAPYVIPAPNPEQSALLESVAQAAAELMRQLLHQSAFRALESAWLGLQWLLRRLQDEPRLYLIDARREQLPELLAQRGALEQMLERAQLGAEAPALVIADFQLGIDADDIAAARALATFAQRNDTLAFAGGDPRLAGCDDPEDIGDPDRWQAPAAQDWHRFRADPAADDLALIAPRFLLRLPYGRRGASTELFTFEEIAEADRARTALLWGNGAWLAALAACNEAPEIDGLPLYIATGDEAVPTCIEALLNDRAAAALKAAGLLPLRAVANSDRIRLPEWISCAGRDA